MPTNEGARNRSPWRLNGGNLAGESDHRSPVQLSSAVPGCPGTSSFRPAGDGVSGCPYSRILQRCRRLRVQVAPSPRFSCIAFDEAPGCPGSHIFRLHRRRASGLPLLLSPSATPTGGTPGCPGSCTFRRSANASPGYPGPCIYVWVDDDSPARLELCILSGAADESSFPTGSCTFLSDSGCNLNLNVTFHCRQADFELPIATGCCIVLSDLNCVPIPYGVTNWYRE